MSTSHVTAAAHPIKFGDQEYLLTPLTDLDIAELDSWVQSRAIDVAIKYCEASKVGPVTRDSIIQSAIKAAASMTWMSGDGAKMMATIEGLSRLVWTSIKKRHPDLKFEQLREHLTNPVNVAAFNAIFRKVNNTSSATPSSTEKKSEPSEEQDQKNASTGL